MTWFKSWFNNIRKCESTLTFLLSQTLCQFEIYEQIFQVSLVVEECLEKGKKQKRLFITWCSTPSTTFRHSRLFLDWDSSEATKLQDLGQRLLLRLETGCNIWLFDVKDLALSHVTEVWNIGLNNRDYFVCLAKTELSLCKLAHLFIRPED